MEKLEGPRQVGSAAFPYAGQGWGYSLGAGLRAAPASRPAPKASGLMQLPAPRAAEPVGPLGWDSGHSLHSLDRVSTSCGPGLCRVLEALTF